MSIAHIPSPVTYREDINGLRAWAVLVVVCFHFTLIGLPGGFIGVDMFYVISGYLMTAIIIRGVEKGNFSIFRFYMSRARRILPALMFLILVMLVLGWFFLPTIDYQELASQSIQALFFTSNIYYSNSSGYFETLAQEKWLLHTWSLAVEAQFYLLYPTFILLVWKLKPGIKFQVIGLSALFLLSFLLGAVYVNSKPDDAFFLLPFRGWELAAGGLVFYLTKLKVIRSALLNNVVYWLGWALIVTGVFLFDESYSWPVYGALIPVAGIGFIILARKEDGWLTASFISQWIGDRSYSIYLWHWPIVVAIYIFGLYQDWFWVSISIVLTFLLAHLSYEYIEVPTRKHLSKKTIKKEFYLVASTALMVVALSLIVKETYFENRMPKVVEKASNERLNFFPYMDDCHGNPDKRIEGCQIGNKDIGALLIGDSHAETVASPLMHHLAMQDKSLKLWVYDGCPNILGFKRAHSHEPNRCHDVNKALFEQLEEYPKEIPLFVVNRLSLYVQGFLPNEAGFHKRPGPGGYFSQIFHESNDELLLEFEQHLESSMCSLSKERTVYLVLPVPEMDADVPKTISRSLIFDRDYPDISIGLEEYKKRHIDTLDIQNKVAKNCNLHILDPTPFLCEDGVCKGSVDQIPLYFDDDHLSETGSRLLTPMFRDIFK